MRRVDQKLIDLLEGTGVVIKKNDNADYSQYKGNREHSSFDPVTTGLFTTGLLGGVSSLLTDPAGCAVWDNKCKERAADQIQIQREQLANQRLDELNEAKAIDNQKQMIIYGTIGAVIIAIVILFLIFYKK